MGNSPGVKIVHHRLVVDAEYVSDLAGGHERILARPGRVRIERRSSNSNLGDDGNRRSASPVNFCLRPLLDHPGALVDLVASAAQLVAGRKDRDLHAGVQEPLRWPPPGADVLECADNDELGGAIFRR